MPLNFRKSHKASPDKQRPLKNIQLRPGKAKNLTTGIHLVFRGLKFEPDTGIGQKGAVFKGLNNTKYPHLPIPMYLNPRFFISFGS